MSLTRRQLLLSSLAAPVWAQTAAAPAAKPNIILILADDLAAWMVGCYGNKEFKTPNIDRLAAMGTRFQNANVATPVCSPSRATLFTGLLPGQHGIEDFLTEKPIENPPQGQKEVPAAFGKIPMMSDLLSAQGYDCGYTGKWHMGNDAQPQHSFRYWHTKVGPNQYQNPQMSKQGEVREEKGYLADIITASAMEFLNGQSADKPFFLVASYLNPHTPYDGHPEKYYQMYENVRFETVGFMSAAPNALREKEYLQDPVPAIRKCAAGVTALDDQIPAYLKKLQEKGLLENTIVVFTGDNGYLLGRHGLWSKGLASDPINMFEEVIEVPLIFSWFGKTAPGQLRREVVSFYDIVPTLCEITGTGLPAGWKSPGKSFAPMLFELMMPKDRDWDDIAYGQYRNTEMIKDRRYKLILRDGGKGKGELYDLQRDPKEYVNQYDNPQFLMMRQKLTAEVERFRKQYS